jgi:hypothetical protein
MSIPRPAGGDINIGEPTRVLQARCSVCLHLVPLGPGIMGEGWTLYTLCTIVVAARVYTQVRLTQQFGAGDVVMIGAWVGHDSKPHFS